MSLGRRTFLAFAATLLPASDALARCASRYDAASEARHARYVFEGRATHVADDGTYTFDVTAVWSGNPPPTLRVTWAGRGAPVEHRHVGTDWLVFAGGESDDALGMSRCGSTSRLPARALVAELTRAGFTRTPR